MIGCAVCAPGFPDWDGAKAVLTGSAEYDARDIREPAPAALPANERRRLPVTARAALGVGLEALQAAAMNAQDVVTVFASCGSDGLITHQICEALSRSQPEMSPTRFHNSVHNAPGGYWSIALASHAASTSLCAHAGSFAVGLVEAVAQVRVEARTVLLVAYDLPYPAPLDAMWPVDLPFSVAMVLAPPSRATSAATLEVALVHGAPLSEWPASVPVSVARNPAAASVPLLRALAQRAPSRVVLPYQVNAQAAIGVSFR